MKIIIIGPAFPLRGGIAHLNESLCRAFIKDGGEAEIVSFSLQYPAFLFPGKTQKEEGTPPGDITIHTKINSVNPFNWPGVASFIKKQKPDLVLIRYWLPVMAPCLGSIARLIKKGRGKGTRGEGHATSITRHQTKIIAICDNVIPHEKRPGDALFTSYFVNACDAFVVMSKSVENDLKQFDTTKPVSFIPHPVYDIFGKGVSKQEALKKLELNPTDKHILFFGFIRKYKGLDLLIKALGNIKLQTSNLKLVIAGEFYDNKEEYLQMIKEYGIENNVIIHSDFIPTADVKYYFCAADIVAQPYHTATQSGVTQIAYHFGRPMLVTDVGGLAEMVAHNRVGYVVPPAPTSIADALTDFYVNTREEEFTANAAIDRSKFTWENMVDGIKELAKRS